MNTNRKFILLSVLLVAMTLFLSLVMPSSVSWVEHYDRHQESPLGTRFIHEIISERSHHDLTNVPLPPVDFRRTGLETAGKTWVNISRAYNPDSLEVAELVRHVEAGMNAFIASRPGDELVSRLGLYFAPESGATGFAAANPFVTDPDRLTVEFNRMIETGHEYRLETKLITGRLSPRADALGTDITTLAEADGQTFFMQVRKGEGTVYLLTSPWLLSNYAVWNPEFEPVAAALLSHLPETPVLWDEYYEAGHGRGDHPLRVILAEPSLSAAWYTLLALTVLFLLFRVKRTGRPVPVIRPPENTTLEHVRKVSRLYQEVDRDGRIADKRIRYLAYRAGLREPTTDKEELNPIAEKFGLSVATLESVMQAYKEPKRNRQKLLQLNGRIEELLRRIERY